MKLFERSLNSEALQKWAWLNTTLVLFFIFQGLGFWLPAGYVVLIRGFSSMDSATQIQVAVGFLMGLCFFLSAFWAARKIRIGYWLPLGLYILSLTRLPDDYAAGLINWGYWLLFGFTTLLTGLCFFLLQKFFTPPPRV